MTNSGYHPPKSLFRANDIRGIAQCESTSSLSSLTPEFAFYLGRAFGTLLIRKNQSQVWLCRDARLSSPDLQAALVDGLMACGCEILDLGIGPTPLLCHAVAVKPTPFDKAASGIMITASHNPPEYNGFKIILNDKPFFGEELAALRELMVCSDYVSGNGQHHLIDHQPAYLADIQSAVPNLEGVKVVLDAANGAAGPLAVAALEARGVDVIPLFCDMDGRFPNHSPDTSDPANLTCLADTVKKTQAFCGIALDGDGDRMVAVTEQGHILNADDLLQLFSSDALDRKPGATIVFDVKSSGHLIEFIRSSGGNPLMIRSGRSFIQAAMFENDACLAGEFSSHFFFADNWYGSDDGIYAAGRLLEICRGLGKSLSEACKKTQSTCATNDIYIAVKEDEKFDLIKDFVANSSFEGANLVTIDGLRIEYPAGWALVRASNTSAAITLRLEADTETELNWLISLVQRELEKIAPSLDLGKLNVS